jgi:hypothetical protein
MREMSAEQPFGHHRAAVGDGQQKEKFRDESRLGHCMIRLDPEHKAIRSREVARRHNMESPPTLILFADEGNDQADTHPAVPRGGFQREAQRVEKI